MNRILKTSFQTALAALVFSATFLAFAPREVTAQVLGAGYNAVINTIKLAKTTNQIITGASTNLTTVNFPASSGAVTLTMPNVTGTVPAFSSGGPATLQQFPQTVFATAGYTNATSTFSNITGLSFAAAANTSYHATCYLTWNPGGATTVGPKYIWTGPASPTNVTAFGQLGKTVTTSSFLSVSAASFATTLDDAVAVTASITQTDVVSVGIINGANAGTVQLQAALHSASGTYTLQNGSYCVVQ